MSRRTFRLALVSTLLLPALAATARANSITTYGVIITAMGNELQVQYVDKPTSDKVAADGGMTSDAPCPVVDGGGKGGSLLVTPNGSGGISVTPFGSSTDPVPSPGKGAAGNDGAGNVDVSNGTVKVPNPDGLDTPPKVDFPDPPTSDVTSTDPTKGDPITTAGPTTTAKTPEPASVTLLALAGLGGLGYVRRRRA